MGKTSEPIVLWTWLFTILKTNRGENCGFSSHIGLVPHTAGYSILWLICTIHMSVPCKEE